MLSIEFRPTSTMTVAEVQTKKEQQNLRPRAHTPKAGQAPATARRNINYFGIFRRMSKTYHEAQMIGSIFFANQPTVRSLSDTMNCFVSTSLWDSFEQKEPQPSATRYQAQPTCTVHQPSVTRNRLSRHVQCIHLPQYATGIPPQPRQPTFLHKPPVEATVQGTQSCSVRHMDGFQHKPLDRLQ